MMKRVLQLVTVFAIGIGMLIAMGGVSMAEQEPSYNENDYSKIQAFLNQSSAIEGKTNGQVLNPNYDPFDPLSWTDVVWSTDVVKRVITIDWYKRQFAGALDVSGFTALQRLNCNFSSITSLDASGCTSLEELFCCENNVASLDVSGCTSLRLLSCYGNNLASLDVSGLTVLETLGCWNNNLTSLDVSSLASLAYLTCYGNNLSALDVSGLSSLKQLFCLENQLSSLDVSGCTALRWLDCHVNNITSLDVSDCKLLLNLYCDHNALTSLNVSGLTSLKNLDCSNNILTSLNVSGLISLQVLYLKNNSITSLDVSGLTALQRLDCRGNQQSSLKVSGCAAMQILNCSENSFTSLDASGLASLRYLDCTYNSLSLLNISGCTSLEALFCYNNNLTSLDTGDAPLNRIVSHSNPMISLAVILNGYSVSATSKGNGYVGIICKLNVDDEDQYLLAHPADGSYFVRWLNGTTTASTDSEYEIPLSGSLSLTAEFASRTVKAPTGMKAASASYTSIKVTWNAVPGASGYQVYLATSSAGPWTLKGAVTTPAYTCTGLVTGKYYYFKVRSYNAAKVYSAYSAVVYARPIPAAPYSVKAARASSTSIKVTWGKVSGATRYELWRSTSATGTYGLVSTTSSLYSTNSRLTKGRTYYYKVRCYHLEGRTKVYSAWSAVVSAKP